MSLLAERCWWCLRGFLVAVNNLYCIPTYVVWVVVLSPLYLFSPETYWNIEGALFHWLLSMVALWSHSAHYRIMETGDYVDDVSNEETLILVNHQSTSDVPLLMAAFSARPNVLPNLNWIMDAIFKYTNFGIVSFVHGDFFINAGRERRDASIQDLVTYLQNTFVPRDRKWLVLFPEGGFLRKRKETSNRYCAKIGLPDMHHVTLPRTGAIQAIMDTIGPNCYLDEKKDVVVLSKLRYVVDMTIAYPKGQPLDLIAIVTGCAPPCVIHFHYRVYPIHQVPYDKLKLQEWLFNRYFEKERMLAKYYSTNEWTVGAASGRFVEQDLLRILLLHLFFLCSTTLHVYLFVRLFM